MLATVHTARFEFTRAEALFRALLDVDEESVEAWRNLGNVLRYQGRCGEALYPLREALRRRPGFALAHSDLLLTLNYLPDIPPEALLAESRAWNDRHAALLTATAPLPTPPRPHDGRIRVGYISPEFRTHSVSYFFEPLLAAHDRDRFTVFCYAEIARPDDTTDRLKGLADGWRWTAGQPDDAVAETIRRDGIQVLVDLAGHSPRHRLPVLARRPAPVQVTWLGYPATTGLSAIGYRFTDAVADPPGLFDRQYSEQLVRLPGGFLCYAAPRDAPPVATPSADAGRPVTFGSFNAIPKITQTVVETWSEILRRVPGSRLLLKGHALGEAPTADRYRDAFAAQGIAPDRIDILGRIPDKRKHLSAYGRIDVALDTFPYNGTTTTCEALWMGVPVVTMVGDRPAARVGASILTHAGFPELIAASPSAYVQLAADLAARPDERTRLRDALRTGLEGSSLCDADAFARSVEDAYRALLRGP